MLSTKSILEALHKSIHAKQNNDQNSIFFPYLPIYCVCMYALGLGQRLDNNIQSFVSKKNECLKVCTLFLLMLLLCRFYRKHPNLDYYFITSTSLVAVLFST